MKRAWQFSLRELFAAVTIVVLVVALWHTASRLDPLEREVQLLRNETGRLTIEDPDLVHAIEVPITGNYRWRWRIHLPQDRDYWLHSAEGAIPDSGLPAKGVGKSRSRIRGPHGPEFILDVAIEKNFDGTHVLAARFGPHSTTLYSVTSDESLPDWFSGEAMVGWTTAGEGATESVAQGQPLVLLRLKSYPVTEPGDGVMIWVAEDAK